MGKVLVQKKGGEQPRGGIQPAAEKQPGSPPGASSSSPCRPAQQQPASPLLLVVSPRPLTRGTRVSSQTPLRFFRGQTPCTTRTRRSDRSELPMLIPPCPSPINAPPP